MGIKTAAPWMQYASVKTGQEILQVNLSQLPAEKRRPTWERIKQHSPATARLLESSEFKQTKEEIEAVFGRVEIAVDLAVLGEESV